MRYFLVHNTLKAYELHTDVTYENVNCSLDVVVLDEVPDNQYPPQKKSFRMLQWIMSHYGSS